VAVLNARLYAESRARARDDRPGGRRGGDHTSLEMPDVLRRVLNQTMQALQVETVALA